MTVNDTLPTEPLGGEDQWTGVAAATFVATTTDTDPDPAIDNSTPTPAASISFRCDLWRNGTTNLGTILSGSGTGIASDSDATLTFTASESDTIEVCRQVTVAGEVHGSASTFDPAWCGEETDPLIPDLSWVLSNLPPPLDDIVDLALWYVGFCVLGEVACDHVFIVTNYVVIPYVDPVVCPLLAARSPGVPGLVDIDTTGDTYIFGERFWDCPPYES